MSDSFFLTKTLIDPERMVAVTGVAALEQFEALRSFLLARVGREAASLFAEPVLSRGNGAAQATVSWYASGGGDAARLADLNADARAEVEGHLKRLLAAVSEALSDPDFGPLLGAALMQDGPDDVWVADRRPYLVNWGMAPLESHGSNASRDQHFAATLGRFLPLAAAPALSREEWLNRGYGASVDAQRRAAAEAATVAPAPATVAPPAASIHPVAAGVPVTPDPSVWRLRWSAPVALLVLFALMLIWLLMPGTLLYPPQPTASVILDDRVADATRASNRSLEDRIAQLRAGIDGAVCTPQGDLVLPSGFTPDGRAPRPAPTPGEQPLDRAQGPEPVQPDALAPPPPSRLVAPAPEGGDPVSLLTMLEQSTALVLAIGDTVSGHGTGFFIGPDLLVTNHHVIAPAATGGQLLVTSETLGEVRSAEVVASLGPLEGAGGDFALLRVSGANAPALTVRIAHGSLKLQQVVAAGYPGFVMETDQGFAALMSGDARAAPGLVVTDGIVNAEQQLGPNTDVVVHTAHISPGNSGGPLVDGCGRLVGVNTFIRNDQNSLNSLNFSLTSGDLVRFLRANGVEPATSDTPCAPTVAGEPAPMQSLSPAPGASQVPE
jgi:hypothetical protein